MPASDLERWATGRGLANFEHYPSLNLMPERRLMNLSPDTIIDLPVESVALAVLQDLHEHGELVRQRWFNDARSLLGTGTHIDILIEAWG
jgi:hypothetical protein